MSLDTSVHVSSRSDRGDLEARLVRRAFRGAGDHVAVEMIDTQAIGTPPPFRAYAASDENARLTMRRLLMWNLQSLDGCFEGRQPWDLDFHETVWGDELERFSLDQADEVGTLLFGRATYEGMAAYWTVARGAIADFMNGVPKVVFSRTLEAATWNNTRLVRADAAEEVAELKRGDGKDMFVFGSAKLCDSLMRHGLFDEYRVCLAPVVLGTGVPLFKPGAPRLDLALVEARTLASGGLILRYAPKV